MYFEKHRSFVNRHGWIFTYTGRELHHLATDRFHDFKETEIRARITAATLLQTATIHHEDKRVLAAKDDIQNYGALAEKCAVWAHEFERTPERKFALSINDVLFFNGKRIIRNTTIKRDSWQFSYTGEELAIIIMNKIDELNKLLPAETEKEREEIAEEIIELSTINDEFNKNPKIEVNLGIGDVVYFRLAPLLNSQ